MFRYRQRFLNMIIPGLNLMVSYHFPDVGNMVLVVRTCAKSCERCFFISSPVIHLFFLSLLNIRIDGIYSTLSDALYHQGLL